jgi:hypothetical protein
MKNIIATLICLLLLIGCGKHESQKAQPIVRLAFTNDSGQVITNSQLKQRRVSVFFAIGSDRDTTVRELKQIHAAILKDSPELLCAEFKTPKTMMQVELRFADGKLTNVNYIVPPNTALEPTTTVP